MTEELWRGDFGDEYSERNAQAGAGREAFWDRMLAAYPANWILEVGCNVGGNIAYLSRFWAVTGVDINEKAIEVARGRGLLASFQVASALALPFDDGHFDLAFTSGVLIHLDDEQLSKAMDELVRVSRLYVLVIEYFGPTTEVVPYRGQEAALWKRPYGRLFAERYPTLTLRGVGRVGEKDGFDNCRWWMFEK